MTATPHTADELVTLIPRFLAGLDRHELADPAAVLAEAVAAGLRPEPEEEPSDRLEFPIGDEDKEALLRRLRPAVTRAIGKPSGGAKVWFQGPYEVHLGGYRDSVELWLRPQYSVLRLRQVAAAWLVGAESREWLVGSGFVAPDAEPDVDGKWPRFAGSPVQPFVRTDGYSPVSVSFFMDPGVHPPGKPAAGDDERYAETLAFFAEELGDQAAPGCWIRGSRSFSFTHMRSRSRSIDFVEAPPGQVTIRGQRVDVPSTPDPDPAEATALLAQLARQRGALRDDALTALTKAGVIGSGAPESWPGGITLTTPRGVPARVRLIDNRVANAAVRLCRTAQNPRLPEESMTGAFGEPAMAGSYRQWSVGSMSAWYGGDAGPAGFQFRLILLEDDVRGPLDAIRKWLVDGEFLPPLRLADSWQGRVLGAAISAEVVPASAPGEPLWRVDDRLAWLSRDQVLIADRSSWPDWATWEIPGLRTVPPSRSSVGSFVAATKRWAATTFDALWQDLVAIGWATRDPDTVVWRTSDEKPEAYVTLRLTAAVNAMLYATVADDGTVSSWRMTVVRSTDGRLVDETAALVRAALEAAGDGARAEEVRQGSLAGGYRQVQLVSPRRR
ncbi:MAG: hypothetical protein QM713_05635 [Arachnia sp.]